MEKIKSQKEKESKIKKNQLIIGTILIAIMIISTIGYSLMDNKSDSDLSNIVDYNGIKFYNQNNFWIASTEKGTVKLQNLPNELNVSIFGIFNLKDYDNKVLYFVNSNSAASLILSNLQNILRYQQACLSGTDCNDFIEKNCSDNLIVFMPSDTNSVKKENNCIFIYGDSFQGADAFACALYGIK